jgi:hypothetical protein
MSSIIAAIQNSDPILKVVVVVGTFIVTKAIVQVRASRSLER